MDRVQGFWESVKLGFKSSYYDKANKISSFKKFMMAILSIVVALAAASILIMVNGESPFKVFQLIISGATKTPQAMNDTLVLTAMYMAVGIGIIISFKAGLFNVGITGQLYLGGAIALLLGLQYHLHWALLTMIGVLAAMVLGILAAILRVYFNIHEVVGTILLNWVVYWVLQYVFRPGVGDYMGTTASHVLEGSSVMTFSTFDKVWIPAIVMASTLVGVYWVIMKRTSLGYSFKTIGNNQSASTYAGMNIKWKMILAMMLSSIGAGLLGAIMFLGRDKVFSVPSAVALPGEGFDGVAVALIAFNSPLGLIPVAFFWGILNVGTTNASIFTDVPKEITSLITGLIMYSVAISSIFIRFRPIKSIMRAIRIYKNPKIKSEYEKLESAKVEQKKMFEYSISKASGNKEEIKKLISEFKAKEKELKKSISEIYSKDIPFAVTMKYKLNKNFWKMVPFVRKEISKPELSKQGQTNAVKLVNELTALERKFKIELNDLVEASVAKKKQDQKRSIHMSKTITKKRVEKINVEIEKNTFLGRLGQKYDARRGVFEKYRELKSQANLKMLEKLTDAKNKEAKSKIRSEYTLKIKELNIKEKADLKSVSQKIVKIGGTK